MPQSRDPTLDTLLDLDGQVLVVDPLGGHWVRFVVTRMPVTTEKPHGLDYSLTLHGPDGGGWWVSITLILSADRSVAVRKTTGADCGESRLMNTGMQKHCCGISGPPWMRPCARME